MNVIQNFEKNNKLISLLWYCMKWYLQGNNYLVLDIKAFASTDLFQVELPSF